MFGKFKEIVTFEMQTTQTKITLTELQIIAVQSNTGKTRVSWPVLAKQLGISHHVLKNNLRLLDNVPPAPRRYAGNPRKPAPSADTPGTFSWNKFVQGDFIFRNERDR